MVYLLLKIRKFLTKRLTCGSLPGTEGCMSWNDNDNDYSYEDSQIRVCHKCWDTYSNCDCEALRLKQALDEAKKEIKDLKKLLRDKILRENNERR